MASAGPVGEMEVQDLYLSICMINPKLDGESAMHVNIRRPANGITFREIGIL